MPSTNAPATMTANFAASTLALLLLVSGCGGGGVHASAPQASGGAQASTTAASPESTDPIDAKLAEVARVHGGAGPWAVAGYRMGEHALRTFQLPRGSFDLEVTHFTPREVQYSCIADGAAAATGASLGKLNLTLVDAPAADTHTTYRQKSTGKTLTLRLAPAFLTRFADVPRPKLASAGREVIQLKDEEIFEVVP